MPKRNRQATIPSVLPRGRPRGRCNELGSPPVLVGAKRNRTATKTDEQIVQAAPLRDWRKIVTGDGWAFRKRRKTNIGAGDKTRMLARVAEVAIASSTEEVDKVKRGLRAEAGVAHQFISRSLVKPALEETRGEQPLPPRFCKHKAHIPKVMFLAATARPRPGFDGKVGIWRVAAPKTAKKTSKNHNKDDVYDEDVTITYTCDSVGSGR